MADSYTKEESDQQHKDTLAAMMAEMEVMRKALDENLDSKVAKLATAEQADLISKQNEQILSVFGAVALAGKIADKGGRWAYRILMTTAAILVALGIIWIFLKLGLKGVVGVSHAVSDSL
jgi:hypothetical protein